MEHSPGEHQPVEPPPGEHQPWTHHSGLHQPRHHQPAEQPSEEAPPRRYRRRMEAKYRRRRFLVAAAAFVTVGAVVAGSVAVSRLQSNISSSPLRSDETAEVLNDNTHGTNILILGSDTRDLDADDYGEAGGARSDAMVLAHLSTDETRIDAVQIPRDTMMDLPPCGDTGSGTSPGGYGAVNSALNFGPGCSVTAVESLSGVRIDHFVEMNFEGFATMVDAMGGLPVCLPEALEDPKAQLDLPAGEQTVDGTDALALARTRYAVGDGSDIARMGHQQRVMSAIVQRAKSAEVLTRPDRLYGFLDAVTSSLTVDEELDSLSALTSLATTAAGVDDSRISFMVMPWAEAPTDPNKVVPSDEAAEVFTRLRADTPLDGEEDAGTADADASESPDEAGEAPADTPVTIINGSTINGKAAQVEELADGWGFTVADTGTAAAAQQSTTISHDGSPTAQQTAQQLADRLELDVQSDTDAGSSGVTLTLGLDIEDAVPAEEVGSAAEEGPADETSDEESQVTVDSAGDMCG